MQPDMRQATAKATATRVMRSSERVTGREKSLNEARACESADVENILKIEH